MTRKVLICGSREIGKEVAERAVERVLREIMETTPEKVEIIQGGCRGIDTIAKKMARRCGMEVRTIALGGGLDDSQTYLLRDVEMVAECDECYAIWNGKSRGTKFTIETCKILNKPVKVIMP